MYQYLKAGTVKPAGWLKEQLKIQAEGLSGHLHEMWPDVRDSAWIGGTCEGWERVPYWLDGFIPLAYLLEDEKMIAVAKKYMDAIMDRQKPDGWICPCSEEERKGYDVWAFFLIGKVLALYAEFSGDPRAEEALYKAMKCLYEFLKPGAVRLFDWGKARWFECMIPLQYLRDRYEEVWIDELAQLIEEEGTDYRTLKERWVRYSNRWTQETHIVNLMMMFKYEAVTKALLGKMDSYADEAEDLWQQLCRYNGTAVGTFTGDECLGGLGNNRGTELCSVAELMYTCEVLYALTGDPKWADRLERAAFNAFPATVSDDMWTHQYVQQVNQIACEKFNSKSFFGSNNDEAHMFGLEPHYGCCTANFNQAWPKLAMSIYLQRDNRVEAALILPSEGALEVNGVSVKITCATEYPFRFGASYMIEAEKPVNMTFAVRVPSWAKNVKAVVKNSSDVVCEVQCETADGSLADGRCVRIADGKAVIELQAESRMEVVISFEDAPHLVERPYELSVLEYGPFVFSLPIETEYVMHEYVKDGVERKFPYWDYELGPKSEWRYGFASKTVVVNECPGDDVPFSSKAPRLTVSASLKPVTWDYAEGYDSVAERVPVSREAVGETVVKELIPYGCAKLRMTEMPE